MTYISFIVEPRDLKFGMQVVLKNIVLFHETCRLYIHVLQILFDFLGV